MLQTFWSKIKDSFFIALTAVFIVLVGILIVWFVIKVVPKAFTAFRNGVATTLDSVFVSGNEESSDSITRKTIKTGESFEISFQNFNENNLYTFYYPCLEGVSFTIFENQEKIECGKDFYLLNRKDKVSIVGFSTKERIVSVPIRIGKQESNSQKVEYLYDFKLTITNPTTNNTDNTKKPEETTNNNVYIPTYYGKPDLMVRITDTGIIDRNTSRFTKTSYINSSDKVAVKFEVRNIGDNVSGIWNFTATLPSLSTPNYQSPNQISLKPGDRIEFTLSFDNPSIVYNNQYNTYAYYNYNLPNSLFTVNVDPLNQVNESVESNNTDSVTVNVYGEYNYNNNNYSGNLTVSCYSIPTNPNTGENVTWYTQVSGGTGSYTYYWSGTDNLVGSSQSISKIYYTSGLKNANVIVTSGNSVISRGCSTSVYGNNNNNNYGNSDLSVRLLGVGMMDSSNNFVYATQIPRYSNSAIKFEVINNGSGNSGPWDLTANMSPSMSWYTYRSNNYPSLAPGQRTEVVVNFSNIDYLGNNNIIVRIDPNNLIPETNESNNEITGTIYVY